MCGEREKEQTYKKIKITKIIVVLILNQITFSTWKHRKVYQITCRGFSLHSAIWSIYIFIPAAIFINLIIAFKIFPEKLQRYFIIPLFVYRKIFQIPSEIFFIIFQLRQCFQFTQRGLYKLPIVLEHLDFICSFFCQIRLIHNYTEWNPRRLW